MKTKPDEKPSYLCNPCQQLMCDDCLSISAEYEFLCNRYKFELIGARDEIENLKLERDRWKRQAEAFEHLAKIGYSELIQGYIDNLVKTQMV